MRHQSPVNHQQRGAVAVMLAVCLIAMFAFMGLALDLSQTYDRKTELQNIADAAALAGAKELKGTAASIDSAVTKAKLFAVSNSYKFGSSTAPLDDAAITFSDSPDTADANWQDIATAKASPVSIFFIKIDTRGITSTSGVNTVNTNFIKVVSSALATTSTYGRAVAGRFAVQVAPLGVCALSPTKTAPLAHPGPPAIADELMEFGYRRGMAYDIINVNPLGATADQYLLNPLDVASSAADNSCTPSNNNVPNVRPFICSGTSNIITSLPGYVFANKGMNATLDADFNARFTSGGAKCTVPPDANIREYPANNTAATGDPTEWMTSPLASANAQTVRLNASHVPFYLVPTPASAPAATTADDWGVLWSYNQAVEYAEPHKPFTTADWPSLYPTTPAPTPTAKAAYPSSSQSPYDQTSGSNFYLLGAGERDRRILNVALIDCNSYKDNGKCSTLNVLGIGRFFMPVQSSIPAHLNTEFAGLVPDAELTAVIRLYQ
ncbi:MAG: pilus assembly protein TadG-related protein [Pseudomonadota bacterium]